MKAGNHLLERSVSPQLYLLDADHDYINKQNFLDSDINAGGIVMGKNWRQLQYEDRLKIAAWMETKMPVAEIAGRLHVSRQTIYRELKRGEFVKKNTDWTFTKVYDPYVAQKHYEEHLKVRGRDLKIGHDLELADYIEYKILTERCSPEAALASIRRENRVFTTNVCVTTVYSYIKKGIFLNLTMGHLPVKKKKHKKKRVKVQKRAQAGDSITLRPAHIETREEFGHWEMDTVVGPQGKSEKCFLVLTERKTRAEIVRLLKNRTAEAVVKEMNKIERQCTEKVFRKIFKTITVDNGMEFSDADGMESSRRNKKRRTKLYYCHPYRSNERGTNENNNRFIRRLVPKGVCFDDMTKTQVQKIENWMNNYPRPMFQYATSAELFAVEIAKIITA